MLLEDFGNSGQLMRGSVGLVTVRKKLGLWAVRRTRCFKVIMPMMRKNAIGVRRVWDAPKPRPKANGEKQVIQFFRFLDGSPKPDDGQRPD